MDPASPPEMSRPAAHVLLQLTVLLWGFTAILGRLISITAVPLVWYRLILVVLVMLVIVPVRRQSLRVSPAAAVRYFVCGAVIGLHWLCFYGAIKQAGIATAVLTLSTITFFTALFEPLVMRRRVAGHEILIGALVVAGVALLIEVELQVDPLGLALGLGSAVFAALFGSLNGTLARQERPERLMLYEMAAAAVVTSACFVVWPHTFVAPWHLGARDAALLLILGVLCTVIPQIWVLRVLRVLSAFTVAVTVNLEPVYALLMILVFFPEAEPLSWRFYAGAVALIGLVAVNAMLKARSTRRRAPAP